jgi:Na+/H+-dicarboxylate symporter
MFLRWEDFQTAEKNWKESSQGQPHREHSRHHFQAHPKKPIRVHPDGGNVGVVLFTIIIGVAITQLHPSTAKPIIRFIEASQKICMIAVSWAMKLVPSAVFSLMAALLLK